MEKLFAATTQIVTKETVWSFKYMFNALEDKVQVLHL